MSILRLPSLKLQLFSVTSGFTRLIIKAKYVCRRFISLHVKFHNNWTSWSIKFRVKLCWWGAGGGKRAKLPFMMDAFSIKHSFQI